MSTVTGVRQIDFLMGLFNVSGWDFMISSILFLFDNRACSQFFESMLFDCKMSSLRKALIVQHECSTNLFTSCFYYFFISYLQCNVCHGNGGSADQAASFFFLKKKYSIAPFFPFYMKMRWFFNRRNVPATEKKWEEKNNEKTLKTSIWWLLDINTNWKSTFCLILRFLFWIVDL